MKILLILTLTLPLLAEKLYEAELSSLNKEAMQNKKIKCRLVCDKKLYKEQKIADALSFYKESKNYKFTTNGFNSFE